MATPQVLDTSILIETKAGFTTIFSLIEYPKAINYEIEILWPEREDYILAIELMAALFNKGKPIPAIDALIASICLNRQLTLRTKDRHFLNIKEIKPDFKVEIN